VIKKSSALIIAVALAGAPVALLALPASAQTARTAVSAPYTEEDDHEGAAMPSAQSEDEGEDEGEDHEDGDHESSHGDNHGVIPPVVIKHHDDDNDDDGDGKGKGGGFVPLPGVTPAPTPAPGVVGSGATLRGGRYEIAPIDPQLKNANGMAGQVSTHGAQIDPQNVPAVDVSGINPSAKTPADIFMESATIGLTAMGVGAIALGGVAGVRAIRLRKNPLGDYFYEADKKD
jgi:hypothetical protein